MKFKISIAFSPLEFYSKVNIKLHLVVERGEGIKLLLSDVISPRKQTGGGTAGLKIIEPQFLAFLFLPATLLLANFMMGNITFFTHLK